MNSADRDQPSNGNLLQVTERIATDEICQATLTLPFESRRKSRQRVRLDDGREAALRLPRGAVLRQHDVLRAEGGLLIEVHAAPEEVSTAFTNSPLRLARAAYHLGNRHVVLEIGHTWLRYLHDHVLDDLVREMGLSLFSERVPFEPEGGAYQETPVHHEHD